MPFLQQLGESFTCYTIYDISMYVIFIFFDYQHFTYIHLQIYYNYLNLKIMCIFLNNRRSFLKTRIKSLHCAFFFILHLLRETLRIFYVTGVRFVHKKNNKFWKVEPNKLNICIISYLFRKNLLNGKML